MPLPTKLDTGWSAYGTITPTCPDSTELRTVLAMCRMLHLTYEITTCGDDGKWNCFVHCYSWPGDFYGSQSGERKYGVIMATDVVRGMMVALSMSQGSLRDCATHWRRMLTHTTEYKAWFS